jgi:hypothetical protein
MPTSFPPSPMPVVSTPRSCACSTNRCSGATIADMSSPRIVQYLPSLFGPARSIATTWSTWSPRVRNLSASDWLNCAPPSNVCSRMPRTPEAWIALSNTGFSTASAKIVAVWPSAMTARAIATAPRGPSVSCGCSKSMLHGNPETTATVFALTSAVAEASRSPRTMRGVVPLPPSSLLTNCSICAILEACMDVARRAAACIIPVRRLPDSRSQTK